MLLDCLATGRRPRGEDRGRGDRARAAPKRRPGCWRRWSRREQPDLVLCGAQSVDAANGATGAALAGLLDLAAGGSRRADSATTRHASVRGRPRARGRPDRAASRSRHRRCSPCRPGSTAPGGRTCGRSSGPGASRARCSSWRSRRRLGGARRRIGLARSPSAPPEPEGAGGDARGRGCRGRAADRRDHGGAAGLVTRILVLAEARRGELRAGLGRGGERRASSSTARRGRACGRDHCRRSVALRGGARVRGRRRDHRGGDRRRALRAPCRPGGARVADRRTRARGRRLSARAPTRKGSRPRSRPVAGTGSRAMCSASAGRTGRDRRARLPRRPAPRGARVPRHGRPRSCSPGSGRSRSPALGDGAPPVRRPRSATCRHRAANTWALSSRR